MPPTSLGRGQGRDAYHVERWPRIGERAGTQSAEKEGNDKRREGVGCMRVSGSVNDKHYGEAASVPTAPLQHK